MTAKKKPVKAKKTGLGMGLDSLIPTEIVAADFDPSAGGASASRTKNVLIKDITPHPEQPRRDFEQAALSELAQSIETHGVLQPLIVVELGNGYQLIAGERRWRAAQLAGLDQVPVIVRSLDEQAKLEVALIENIQRQDLNPLEMAQTYARLNKEFKTTFDAIAERLGKSQSTVHNIVRLLGLPEAAKKALQGKKISEGHARSILALPTEAQQLELLDLILKKKWSVRKTEQYVKGMKEGAQDAKNATKKTVEETKETKAIGKKLKAKVSVYNMAKGGRLIIEYKDDKHLKRITKSING